MATASFGFGPFSVSGYDPIGSYFEGSLNSYFDKKSEKRAYERQLALMAEQYKYAQRYAENSPSWNVKGLRDAGLNPILAVSNGSHLGSTVPSVPSVTSHKPTPSTSSGGFRYDPQVNSQLRVNEATIRNLDSQSSAALLRADSEAKKAAADVALRTVETEKLKGSKYDSSIMRDAERLIKDIIDLPRQFNEIEPYTPYIHHTPKSPNQTNSEHLRDLRESSKTGAHSRYVNPLWKSRKTIDGSPVYRKRGDVGGVMHMYR